MDQIEEGYSLDQHVEGQSRRLDAPELSLNLARELEELRQAAALRANGHSAKTLVKYPNLRVVLIAFMPGARLGEHRTAGQISVQVLEGRVRFELERQQLELAKDALFALGSSIPHDVEAMEASALLLTIAWPQVGGASHP